jgi:hypothetical protein
MDDLSLLWSTHIMKLILRNVTGEQIFAHYKGYMKPFTFVISNNNHFHNAVMVIMCIWNIVVHVVLCIWNIAIETLKIVA